MPATKNYRQNLFRKIKLLQSAVYKQPLLFTVIFLCAVTFLAFSKLASEVLEGEGRSIDTQIMLLLREPNDSTNPLGPKWFEEMMRDISGLGSVAILTFITLASALYLSLINKKGLALYLLAAVGTGAMFSSLLKAGFDRPRPDLVPHGTTVYSASFPSGHSLIAAIVYLTLAALLAESQPRYRLKIYFLSLAIVMTLLIGISRVYLGVHWPSDVVAGWLGGSAWAFMFWIIAHYARKLHLQG